MPDCLTGGTIQLRVVFPPAGIAHDSSEARTIIENIDSTKQSALEALAYTKLKLSHSIVFLTTPNFHSQIFNDTANFF